MNHRWTPPLVCLAVLWTGCFGTEAGNPDPVPRCQSFMSGLLEKTFTVPRNAPGIPLQFNEHLRPDAALTTAELTVTRNDEPEMGWELQSGSGALVPSDGLVNGPAQLVFAAPLVLGDRIDIVRHIDCDNLGTGDVAPDNAVEVTVAPDAPIPVSAGTLEFRSPSVALTLSPEAVSWRNHIAEASLTIGDQRLDSQGLLADEFDRDLSWILHSGSCVECGTQAGTEDNDSPQVCYEHVWPPGPYELTANVRLFGFSAAIGSPTVDTTFADSACAN